MKEQYVGDVNDYRKYALLRTLCGNSGLTVGVCWMLTPPDNRSDGGKIRYLKQPHDWERYDPVVFQSLKATVGKLPGLRLRHIEDSGILPNARFFGEVMPDKAGPRKSYFATMQMHFRDMDLIFLDPDIGLQIPSKPKGRSGSSQYLYIDEVADIYRNGHSILIYQHFPREKRTGYIRRTRGRLADVAWGAQVHAFETPHVLFLLLVHPKHSERLSHIGQSIKKKWPRTFLRCADDREAAHAHDGRKTAESVGSPATKIGEIGEFALKP